MKRLFLWAVTAGVLLPCVGLGIWLLSLPAPPSAGSAKAVPADEVSATLQSLRPMGGRPPVIAILGANGKTRTEMTDYIVPYGILRRADVANVMVLSTEPGIVALYPALQVEPDATVAQFDAQYPAGADYVIVPAMSRDDDPAVIAWLRSQHSKHATVISVCAGAKVVAAAGLLDGKRATTHWYYRAQMLKRHPTINFVRDRRFVVDGKVATTTGITASMPMMLALIEAIGGREKAEAVAADLGVAEWDGRHITDAFLFSRPFASTVLQNSVAFWNHEHLGVRLKPGVDEVSLAMAADSWSRTYRSRVSSFADGGETITTRSGLRIRPDQSQPAGAEIDLPTGPPVQALDDTLRAIAGRYGSATADIVAAQLEYPKAVMTTVAQGSVAMRGLASFSIPPVGGSGR